MGAILVLVDIQTILKQAIIKLYQANIETAQLDVEVLLADLLEKDRAWILAHPEYELTEDQAEILNAKVSRRASHEPLAYIRGFQEFYGREFIVNKDVLVPRPESETMLELLLEYVESRRSKVEIDNSKLKTQNSKLSVIDIGTGSGCIIITAALEMSKIESPKSKVSYVGLDVSKKALQVAKKNALKHTVDITFNYFNLNSSTFDFGPSTFDIILANLPYVPEDYPVNKATNFEPGIALFAGKDGLNLYRKLFEQLATAASTQNSKLKTQNCVVFTESLPEQHAELAIIAKTAGFTLKNTQDLIQVFEKIPV